MCPQSEERLHPLCTLPRLLPRSRQHGGQSRARRPAVGPIRRIRANRKPRRKRLLYVRIQGLPAECRPRGHRLILHQRERLQRGTDRCPRCDGRYDYFTSLVFTHTRPDVFSAVRDLQITELGTSELGKKIWQNSFS